MKFYRIVVIVFLLTNKIMISFTRKVNNSFLNKRFLYKKELNSLSLVPVVGINATNQGNKSVLLNKLAIRSSPLKKRRELLSAKLKTVNNEKILNISFINKLQNDSVIDENEMQQFCGETLYYVLEYYCTHLKRVKSSKKEIRRYVTFGESDNESSSGIVNECCYKACKVAQLASYCN